MGAGAAGTRNDGAASDDSVYPRRRGAFERALGNMRELAEMVTKSNQQATSTINSRISASLDELKDVALKMKQPAA